MEKVWEARVFSKDVVFFLIISLVVILYCTCFWIKSQHNPNSRTGKIICIVIMAILAVINLQNIGDRYNEIKYAERNSLIIEGRVDNLLSYTNGADSFTVNDVYFSYPTIESLIGYDIPKRENNSIINHEGQYVKITYYVKNDVNIIVKIETEI